MSMIIADFLRTSEEKLKVDNIGSARLDCLILLEDELGKDRAWILANQGDEIDKQTIKRLDQKIKLRAEHWPLAYIRGFSEFYGRKFVVNKDVLEPRPETEVMIEMLLELPDIKSIADIGTGSGALAITAKIEIPEAEVVGVDIDPNCLSVAKKNAKTIGAKVKFFEGDLLEPLIANNSMPTAVLANLPYVPANFYMNEAAKLEPKIATYGGPDGLDLYRRFFEQVQSLEQRPKYILTESLPPQHAKLAEVATASGYRLALTRDLIQLFEA
jgi:release factor glutamine methyltransferase